MKCIDVQSELWFGRKSAELDDHLATCVNCQREMAEIRQIVSSLKAIEVPAPSRSLIPQREVIEHTVQHNRRKPWKRISTVAAAATVVVGVGTGLAINQLHSGTSQQQAGQTKTIDSGKESPVSQELVTVQTKDDPELLQAVKKYYEQVALAEGVSHIDITGFSKDPQVTDSSVSGVVMFEVTLRPDSKTAKYKQGTQKERVQLLKKAGNWTAVPYFEQNDATLYTPEQRIETYFNKTGLPDGVKAVTVRSFAQDPQTDDKIMTGKVTLQVDLMPNQSGVKPAYQQGLNDRFVLLTKVQGVWEVDKIGTQRFTAADAPVGTRDFEKTAQIMYGTLTEVQISSPEETGTTSQRLHYLKLKVEKNATTSNDPDKGKELMIGYETYLPQGYVPKPGDQVALLIAKGDPRVNAGMDTWTGKREYFFYQKNGQYYDLLGKITDPMQAYLQIQSAR